MWTYIFFILNLGRLLETDQYILFYLTILCNCMCPVIQNAQTFITYGSGALT